MSYEILMRIEILMKILTYARKKFKASGKKTKNQAKVLEFEMTFDRLCEEIIISEKKKYFPLRSHALKSVTY